MKQKYLMSWDDDDDENDDNMRGWDPASEDDSHDNGMSRWSENNDGGCLAKARCCYRCSAVA